MSWKAHMHLLNSKWEKTGNHLELEKCRASEEPFTLWSIIHMLSSLPRVMEDSVATLGPLQHKPLKMAPVWLQGNTKAEENETICDMT